MASRTSSGAGRLASLQPRESGKIVSAEEAVRLIRGGDTVATGGFVGIGFAEEIAFALEVLLFAVLVPVQTLIGPSVWFASVAVACLVFGVGAGIWVARGVDSRPALHGLLVGVVATLIYVAICIAAPGGLPAVIATYGAPLYFLNNALRIAGCLAGAAMQGAR